MRRRSAVMGHAFWRRRFAAARGVGPTCESTACRSPSSASTARRFPGSSGRASARRHGASLAGSATIPGEDSGTDADVRWLQMIGRLKPGTTSERVRATWRACFSKGARRHGAVLHRPDRRAARAVANSAGATRYLDLVVHRRPRHLRLRHEPARSAGILSGVVVLGPADRLRERREPAVVAHASRRKEMSGAAVVGARGPDSCHSC